MTERGQVAQANNSADSYAVRAFSSLWGYALAKNHPLMSADQQPLIRSVKAEVTYSIYGPWRKKKEMLYVGAVTR